jgi:hypothetical protein
MRKSSRTQQLMSFQLQHMNAKYFDSQHDAVLFRVPTEKKYLRNPWMDYRIRRVERSRPLLVLIFFFFCEQAGELLVIVLSL